MLEDTSDRKIAVIFATDVVGYSKSIEQNENQTLINQRGGLNFNRLNFNKLQ